MIILEREYWCKGFHRNGKQCLCCAHETREELRLIRKLIHEKFPDRVKDPFASSLSQFNDHPDTLFEDVMMILNECVTKDFEM